MTRKQAAEEILRNGPEDEELLMETWTIGDIISQANKSRDEEVDETVQEEFRFTEEDAQAVMVIMECRKDCTIGINCDFIQECINEHHDNKRAAAKAAEEGKQI